MTDRAACERVRGRWLAGEELGTVREEERAHLASCAACRSALARLERDMGALAAGLDAFAPALTAEEAVEVARRGSSGRVGSRGSDRPARRRAWLGWPITAAAAALLAVVLAGPWRPEGRRGEAARAPEAALARPAPDPADEEPLGFSVDVPESGRVAVFATADPDIHVVWFY